MKNIRMFPAMLGIFAVIAFGNAYADDSNSAKLTVIYQELDATDNELESLENIYLFLKKAEKRLTEEDDLLSEEVILLKKLAIEYNRMVAEHSATVTKHNGHCDGPSSDQNHVAMCSAEADQLNAKRQQLIDAAETGGQMQEVLQVRVDILVRERDDLEKRGNSYETEYNALFAKLQDLLLRMKNELGK